LGGYGEGGINNSETENETTYHVSYGVKKAGITIAETQIGRRRRMTFAGKIKKRPSKRK